MKKIELKTVALFISIISMFAILAVSQAVAAEAVGKITRLNGEVSVNRGSSVLKIGVGTRVLAGDIVETKEASSTKILMLDGSVLSLGPKSKMRIRNFSTDKRTNQTAANYDLVYGRGRANIPKTPGARKDIKFSTPTAVAGVRGTELIFEYDPATGQTRMIAVDEAITITNANGETITLQPGMGVTIGPDGVISSPFDVPIDEINRLRNEANSGLGSPRKVVVVNLPGTGGLHVTIGETGGGVQIILGDTGIIFSPEDLIDQEPPPYTLVDIKLNIKEPIAK